jgi:hypothetical protein
MTGLDGKEGDTLYPPVLVCRVSAPNPEDVIEQDALFFNLLVEYNDPLDHRCSF